MRAAAACVLIAASVGAGAAGATSTPLSRRLTSALTAPQVDNTKRSAVAIDLKTGELVYRLHQFLSLEPASNEKLPVTFAALETFGPGFRIRTDAVGEGGQAGKVWHGNLVLVGHGDPTLSSGRLASLAAKVRAAGIRRVTGSIIGDESFFDSRRGVVGWKSSFYYNESPPLSALAADRCVYLGKLAMHPAVAAAAIFRHALISAGVAVAGKSREGTAPDDAIQVANVYSPPLWKILRFMDRWSDNFSAELLLKQLGARQGNGTSAGGAAAVTSVLAEKGIPLTGVRIVDGSGLSMRDRLTGRALAGVLQAAWADGTMRKAFRSILAVAGRDGTMRNRLRTPPARGNILAKTGTTDEASALSGYANGRYAFAVVSNGFPLASWFAKQAEDRFVTVLAGA